MARIRTIKPEFWTHPVMARLDAEVQLLALGLLTMADDRGYFFADPAVVRGTVVPFREDLASISRGLATLSGVGWIDVREHPDMGLIGLIHNWKKHQKVDHPSDSKIEGYFVASNSRNPREALALEQGTGNREQDVPPYPPSGDIPADAGAADLPAPKRGKGKEKGKPKGRDYGIEALKMAPEEETAFDRAWKGWPAKGWNFTTRNEAPRRLDYAESAKRFHEILKFTDIRREDGTRITAEDLADSTLAFVEERKTEARRQGLPAPCIPCIANFFSSCEGQKHPWKEALMKFFGAVPEDGV